MLSGILTPKSCKFITHRSLLITDESPLPRLPGCLGSCSASYPEGSLADYSAGYPVENPDSYPDGNSVSYSADCPEGNSASYPENSGEGSSPDSSADSSENRSGSNPESSREGNGANYSESYPKSSDARPVTEPAQVQAPDARPDWQLPEYRHRVPERGRDYRCGFNRARPNDTNHPERSQAAIHRPRPPSPPRRTGLHPPRQANLKPPPTGIPLTPPRSRREHLPRT